ncbi:hypothetical protein CYMTET_19130 [Cymbomonas tetramitiformis]|uniref:Cyclic nucleotide-binding domain-containing protein n=1 Tax=Cymbomonas tetramitiformis TaxID=36881 RepID=A0AAE0L5M0_9CHLO|nr:hypothetical protein CYMTET_19130 [Cymbomonas tetramitiformis]
MSPISPLPALCPVVFMASAAPGARTVREAREAGTVKRRGGGRSRGEAGGGPEEAVRTVKSGEAGAVQARRKQAVKSGGRGRSSEARPAANAYENPAFKRPSRTKKRTFTHGRGNASEDDTVDVDYILQRQIKAIHNLITVDAIRDGSNIRDVSSFYIDPRSHFRVYWDLTVVTLVIYTTVSIPFQFAFNPDQPQALEVLDYLIDALFVVDIWLNFYTAFFDSFGRMKAKKEHIVSNYMGGWFMWDVLATIPAEVILVAVDQGGGQAQLFSLLKFPRLLRLGRIIKYMERQQFATTMHIARLVLMVLLVCHWMGCVWWVTCDLLTSSCKDEDGEEEVCWCKRAAYADLQTAYVTSLYTAILSTMGEGADTQSDEQRMIAGTMTLFGSFMMAMVFGNVAALINGMNSKAMEFQSHAQSCDEVMQYLQVPTEIQERVKQFFEYSWLRFRGVTGIEGFTAQLSPYLREEIVTYFRCHVVMEVPYFVSLPSATKKCLMLHMETVVGTPGDVMLQAGMSSGGLFFVAHGSAKVLFLEEPAVKTLLHHGNGESRKSRGRRSRTGSGSRSTGKMERVYTGIKQRTSSMINMMAESTGVQRSANKEMNQILLTEGLPGTILLEGDYFGEMSLMYPEVPSAASVLAVTFVDAHVLSQEGFQAVCKKFPDLMPHMKMRERELNAEWNEQYAAYNKAPNDSPGHHLSEQSIVEESGEAPEVGEASAEEETNDSWDQSLKSSAIYTSNPVHNDPVYSATDLSLHQIDHNSRQSVLYEEQGLDAYQDERHDECFNFLHDNDQNGSGDFMMDPMEHEETPYVEMSNI